MTKEMEQYRIAVQNYARNGINYLFHNRGDEHALIILTNIFKNAKRHIRIAANKLYNDEVVNTPEYVESMKAFLDQKDTRLDILITRKPTKEEVTEYGPENTLYWMLYNHPAYRQGRVEIKEGQGSFFKNEEGEQVNFCTGDEKMFRLEGNVVERQAIANFNDEDATRQLIEAFDRVYPSLTSKVELKDYYAK